MEHPPGPLHKGDESVRSLYKWDGGKELILFEKDDGLYQGSPKCFTMMRTSCFRKVWRYLL